MGICYSSPAGNTNTQEGNCWWKSKNDTGGKVDATFKKTASADFASFIGKFSGAGGGSAVHEISGRLFANGASSIASLYTQQGKKGTNQDAMIAWENFGLKSDTVFCGIFDGHGPYGHMVARKVRDCLPLLLCTQWEANSSSDRSCARENGNSNGSTHFDELLDEDLCESVEVEGNEKVPDMYMPLKQSVLKAFKLMDKELKLHPTIDCFCSGSTAVTLIKQGQDLVIGNVGDSRAVLATRNQDNSLNAVQLTVDLKPNLPREAARIHKYKGRVFALQDEPEVARVWLPNSDSPGLAMARAFGDFCLKDFGLISVPDVYYRRITERDEFIVLATDGVWDVLSNREAVDIVASAPGRATAARALVDCATRAWRLKYPTSKIDDCAVVCLFLDHVVAPQTQIDSSNIPTEEEQGRNSDAACVSSSSHLPASSNSLEHSNGNATVRESCGEITAVAEESSGERRRSSISGGQSKRSLAECLLIAEDEEWSALEGVSRVNSLLSLPRFLSMDKRSNSWRKWL